MKLNMDQMAIKFLQELKTKFNERNPNYSLDNNSFKAYNPVAGIFKFFNEDSEYFEESSPVYELDGDLDVDYLKQNMHSRFKINTYGTEELNPDKAIYFSFEAF